jgi:hypothetical protein
VFAIALALVVLQATGLHGFLTGEVCVVACDDDTADGQCEPSCNDCACCLHARPLTVAATAALPRPLARWALSVERAKLTLDPTPRDIAHVPKPSLA